MQADELIPSVNRRARQDERWKARARCRIPALAALLPRDFFFPELGTANNSRIRNFCEHCPVQSDCLEYALANSERHGCWGGRSERERRRIARARSVAAASRLG